MAGEKFDDLNDTNRIIRHVQTSCDEDVVLKQKVQEAIKAWCVDSAWKLFSWFLWILCFAGSFLAIKYVVKSFGF
jgi:hypothetical protein